MFFAGRRGRRKVAVASAFPPDVILSRLVEQQWRGVDLPDCFPNRALVRVATKSRRFRLWLQPIPRRARGYVLAGAVQADGAGSLIVGQLRRSWWAWLAWGLVAGAAMASGSARGLGLVATALLVDIALPRTREARLCGDTLCGILRLVARPIEPQDGDSTSLAAAPRVAQRQSGG